MPERWRNKGKLPGAHPKIDVPFVLVICGWFVLVVLVLTHPVLLR